MGLDVYLYEAEQARKNTEYNAACEALYTEGEDGKTPRDRMSAEEYAAWQEQYDTWTGYTSVPSERYPEHLFDRRYLRSSYNGGGFNHAVPEMLGASPDAAYPHQHGSLYWIFEPLGREWDGDEGNMTADDVVGLGACRDRALGVADALRKCDPLRVVTVSGNMFLQPPTYDADGALAHYREHIAARSATAEDDGWYSTRDLEVFGGGLSVLAAVPGLATFGQPGVHLIYRNTHVDSYIESAEITAEFCDEAIGLIERDGSCQIRWSG